MLFCEQPPMLFCEQPPMLFCDRKPRCLEAHCFKKLDCVSLDRRVRIFRHAEMNGDLAPSPRRQLDLRVVPDHAERPCSRRSCRVPRAATADLG